MCNLPSMPTVTSQVPLSLHCSQLSTVILARDPGFVAEPARAYQVSATPRGVSTKPNDCLPSCGQLRRLWRFVFWRVCRTGQTSNPVQRCGWWTVETWTKIDGCSVGIVRKLDCDERVVLAFNCATSGFELGLWSLPVLVYFDYAIYYARRPTTTVVLSQVEHNSNISRG